MTYLRRVILSITGLVLGEVVGVFVPGPRLGELHPAWDALITALLQLGANRLFHEA